MTRINVRPVSGINTKQLHGEFVEILRPFVLVRNRYATGKRVEKWEIPDTYRLGPGHVKFFYDKFGYLMNRYAAIRDELRKRGMNIKHRDLREEFKIIPDELWGDYEPTEVAQLINEARIQQALREAQERGTI